VPAQASLSPLVATDSKAGAVDISSSDTEGLLDSLFLSPTHGYLSMHRCENSDCHVSSDADSFESWPEPNDMAASVYVALSTDALSSCKPTTDASHDLLLREPRKTRWSKPAPPKPLRKKCKKMKVDINRALAAPTSQDNSLLAAGFERSEWEIMYPLFVAKGIVDTSACVNR
jgi:hypothetical protein